MREVFSLASRGTGRVSPNPLVGALLVKNGQVVARGYHRRFGGPHAEAECLRAYNGSTSGTTLYVNLEPCSHDGKTPPCADLLIQRGIPRVVVAMKDPNPLVSGRGISRLRNAGVHVVTGILEKEAVALNRHFVHHIRSRRPYVHVKVAQTLDGRLTMPHGMWFTSVQSRRLVHTWRSTHDALMVGAGTIAADDPQLTVRGVRGRNPDVVILDGRMTVSPRARVFRPHDRRVILCVTAPALGRQRDRFQRLLARGNVELVVVRSRRPGIPLEPVLHALYRLNIGSVMVEGGSALFSQFFAGSLIDELSVFIAPVLSGEGPTALPGRPSSAVQHRLLRRATSERVGHDLLLRAFKD